MLLDILRQQDIVDVEVPIIFLRRGRIDDPFVVHHELVVDLLVGIGQVDLFLPDIANLVELFAFAPIIEGTGNVDILRLRMRPNSLCVSSLT